jgi:hypothetical protein
MCADGRICDGKTIATLLMYERFFRHGKHGQSTAKTDG